MYKHEDKKLIIDSCWLIIKIKYLMYLICLLVFVAFREQYAKRSRSDCCKAVEDK